MRDQYIPDMTERFPEGLDGLDYTDSYFGGGMSDEDIAWRGMEDEYHEYMQGLIRDIQYCSDDELQEMYEEQRQGFGDDLNPEDFKESDGYQLMKAIENEWERRAQQREAAPKSYFIAWYDDSDNSDQYEIYQASDLEEAISIATADLGDSLQDVQPYEP